MTPAWRFDARRGYQIPIQGWTEKQKPRKDTRVVKAGGTKDDIYLPTVSKAAAKLGAMMGAPIHRQPYPDRQARQLLVFPGNPTSAAHLGIDPSPDDILPNPVRQASARWIGWGHKLEPDRLFHYNSLHEQNMLKDRDRCRVIVSRHNLWPGKPFRDLTWRPQGFGGRSFRHG